MAEGFKNLRTWQRSYELGLDVYLNTKSFPSHEQFALTSQLRKAVISVSANIAEGYQRQHRKEYIQFLNIARGSLGEVETYLMFARDLGYLDEQKYLGLACKLGEVGGLLTSLIRSLRP